MFGWKPWFAFRAGRTTEERGVWFEFWFLSWTLFRYSAWSGVVLGRGWKCDEDGSWNVYPYDGYAICVECEESI